MGPPTRIGRRPRPKTHQALALKLPGIGKEAVIDINSCDSDKIQRALEEMSNYIGTNTYGGIGHCIQRSLDTRENYPFADEAPHDPRIKVTTNPDLGNMESTKVNAMAWEIMNFEVRGKFHIIMV